MSEKISLNDYIQSIERAARRFPSLTPRSTLISAWAFLKLLHFLFGPKEYFYRELSAKKGILPEWQFILNYLYNTGVITSPHLLESELLTADPEMFFFHLMVRDVSHRTDGHKVNPSYARASSFDFSQACQRTIGEFLERYSLSIFKLTDFVRGSTAHLTNNKISHLDLSLLANEEAAWDSNSVLNWITCKKLSDRSSLLVPAQLIFRNYCTDDLHRELLLREPNSNGGAGAFTLEKALLHGIYELIERDAFFVFWQNRISPPRVNLDNCSNEELQAILGKCKEKQLRVTICDITADLGLPTFAAVVHNTRLKAGVSVGTASGTNPYQTMKKAIEEALMVRHWMESRHFDLMSITRPEPKDYKTRMERAAFWSTEAAIAHIEFLVKGSVKEAGELVGWEESDNGAQLQRIQKLLLAKGEAFESYCYEARSGLLDTLGYKAVKVIIPGLIPLVINSTGPSDSKRRIEAAKALGYIPLSTLHSTPHPLF